MTIGPLEYVVIGIRGDRFAEEVLPALAAIQDQGSIAVVDLLFVERASDGTITTREISELAPDTPSAYDSLGDGLSGLLTAEDIAQLAEQVPLDMSAVIVVFEHVWTGALRDAIRRAQGVMLGGGMATPDTLARVEAELAASQVPTL